MNTGSLTPGMRLVDPGRQFLSTNPDVVYFQYVCRNTVEAPPPLLSRFCFGLDRLLLSIP